MYTRPASQLQDLVEKPVEREWLDLKSWVDLSTADHVARATCAKHLAAIANYGGGYLVFGFEDDGKRCAQKNDVRAVYAHDVFAGIIDKYLQPKFQCEVSFPEFEGVEHAVVWVPSHGVSPVIAKADGPKDSRGVIQGIKSGAVYIRAPKPESVPVSTPEHWERIIQRCVLARRDEMVSMFSAIVAGGAPKAESGDKRERLTAWHRATQQAAFQEAGRVALQSRYPLTENFVQFSYVIRHRNGRLVKASKALEVTEKLNTVVRDTVNSGWSMFYPFRQEPIAPRFSTDAAVDGGNTEFLQASMMEGGRTRHADFWRLSFDGRASVLRGLQEDNFERSPHNISTGQKWLDPWLHVRDITELVRHARAFAEEFEDVSDVCFMLEWRGLNSRVIASLANRYYSEIYTAHSDARTVYEPVPLAEIIGDLPIVVARLFAPVYRIFDPRADMTAAYVKRELQRFIESGL
jgi:hypothetical protein